MNAFEIPEIKFDIKAHNQAWLDMQKELAIEAMENLNQKRFLVTKKNYDAVNSLFAAK